MRRWAPLIFLAITCSARLLCAQSTQTTQLSEQTLVNGLHVVYAPMHQAPLVQVRVVYHVGSRDEQPGRRGFAHLFEHMMFRGSAHVPPQEHLRLIRAVGGVCNGRTEQDI